VPRDFRVCSLDVFRDVAHSFVDYDTIELDGLNGLKIILKRIKYYPVYEDFNLSKCIQNIPYPSIPGARRLNAFRNGESFYGHLLPCQDIGWQDWSLWTGGKGGRIDQRDGEVERVKVYSVGSRTAHMEVL
jgi:hypothetical protein